MDSIQVILITFSIWFFSWHTIESLLKQQKMNRVECYALGLLVSLVIYFSNLDKEDNE